MSRLIHCLAATILPIVIAVSHAQQTQTASPDVVSQKVFIGNAGGDFGRDNVFGGDLAYNEFFAGIKDWGHLEIVANPALADWVFEISISDSPTCVEERPRDGRSHIQHHNRIKLVVADNKKTRGMERTFTEYVSPPGLFSNPAKNVDQAIVALLDDAKGAIGEPVAGKTSLKKHDAFMAPVPPRLGSARTVYIDNAGANDLSGDWYSGGGGEVYSQLSAVMKTWGRYKEVSTPDQADLVFRVYFSMHAPCADLGDPFFDLLILDAKTDVAMWGISLHVEPALLERNARKNFASSVTQLVGAVREVAERPTWLLDASTPASAPPPATETQWVAPAAVTAEFASLPPIPVTISAQTKVKLGAELQIDVTVRNASKQALDFAYPTGDPLTCLVAVRDAGGNVVADTVEGSKLKAAHAGWQGRPLAYDLQPGESQNRQCPVSRLFDMSRPGSYSIEVTQLDGRQVRSNTVLVTVTP